MAEPAENKELLGGLYVQDHYDVNGDPEPVRATFNPANDLYHFIFSTLCWS